MELFELFISPFKPRYDVLSNYQFFGQYKHSALNSSTLTLNLDKMIKYILYFLSPI